MHNPSQENAMTEIALALAMGFFSIMVLTMVSMGVEGAAQEESLKALQLAVPATTAEEQQAAGVIKPGEHDVIVIYDGNRFLDRDLKPIDPLTIDQDRRVILALDPGLPLKEALATRAQFANSRLIVSSLDERWLAAIARKRQEAGQ